MTNRGCEHSPNEVRMLSYCKEFSPHPLRWNTLQAKLMLSQIGNTQIEFRRRLSVLVGAGRETCGDWEVLRNRMTSATRQTLGIAVTRRRWWTLSPSLADFVNRRRHARLTGDIPLYCSLRGGVTKALRDAEEARVREVCGRLLGHMFTCNSGPAFKAISFLPCGESVLWAWSKTNRIYPRVLRRRPP